MAFALVAPNAWALKSYSSFHPAKRDSVISQSAAPRTLPGPSWPGTILDSPGRVVGTTYYDMQANGSTGNRIVLDSNGRPHFCWISSTNSSLAPRNIRYGYIAGDDSLRTVTLPGHDQDGFPGIDVYNGSINPSVRDYAVIGYHNSSVLDDRFAFDSGIGQGIFSIDSLTFPVGSDSSLWPQFSIDINDDIQAVAIQSNVQPGELMNHIYTRKNFGQSNWSAPVTFDQTYCPSPVITSSPVSAKSAIVWTHPIFQDYNQYDNDVVYAQSLDGTNWDFSGGRVNITQYPYSAQCDTTLRAYTDVDAIYDHNDNLHIIWNAAYVTRDTANSMVVLYHTALFHWSQQNGIDLIYDHPVREWPCDMGAWNLAISKMSIGVDDSNFLFVVFTRFDPSDYAFYDTTNGDVSPCGGDNSMPCGNGEIYMSYSVNGGDNWTTPVNLTNSPSPNCTSGNCDSDNWPGLAERVDQNLHILYIDDKDAGALPLSEGDATANPVIYLEIPNPTRTAGGCDYVVGDINGNSSLNGLDVVYGVSYFKGGPLPPYSCECTVGNAWFVSGDVNASCNFNGLDISYLVSYFKGGPAVHPCADCPPNGR